ncbi:MAG: Hint domain-containing protein [Pseudomonadota bacterium]
MTVPRPGTLEGDTMAASLNGVIFHQLYPDNSGAIEYDSDGDGTATQEDEFLSVQNTTGAPVDISGWQIWSDSAGGGAAPDTPKDGHFHTFPPGTVLQPGETLYVINEITGPEPDWAQEASQGGAESGAGSADGDTNFMTEGMSNGKAESVGLVDPVSGDYIVFNMAPGAHELEALPGFPGTNQVGEVDGNAVQKDPAAGYSYQYNSSIGGYEYDAVFVPCFAEGTLIATPGGAVPVEVLVVGDLVLTLDHGPQPLRGVLRRCLDFCAGADAKDKPIAFAPGSLGDGSPQRQLVVSPQHRMLIRDPARGEVLAPAKAFATRPGVRVLRGRRRVGYVQLVLDRHEIVFAEGAAAESFFPGPYAMSACSANDRRLIERVFPSTALGLSPPPARPLLRVGEARMMLSAAIRQAVFSGSTAAPAGPV